MPKASELKRGMFIEINSTPHAVKQVDSRSPSSRGASTLYKIRYTNLKTGQKLDESYKGDDFLKEADCIRVKVQYSYNEGESYVFMDSEDYSQYTLNEDELEGQTGYISEGLEDITALIMDGNILGIELPATVELEIMDTAPPGIKGSSATARTKAALLPTAIEVQVPEYLETGEVIKVNTVTGKYMSRA
ncbi:elongation factor P-like protein YeiP [Methylococcaceae bacterium HT1]|nr:elongation factor P-like protein YeiP [Methylococcaceae bacterium HT1]